jgi:hypothetical protein
MRDSDGKLAGWDLPRNHFAIEEIPEEVKYPQSYQATFGGTPGTAHMTGEGVVFVYFNYGSKTFERLKIKPAHTHIFIQTEKRPLFLLKDQIPFYLRDRLSNQHLGCPCRQPRFNNQRQCRLS